MNVFDFDKTIYNGDSTVDFCFYLMGKYPKVILDFISNLPAFLRYKAKKITKTEMKQCLYKCFKRVPDMKKETELFWDKNIKNIEKWYLEIKDESDIVITASPQFLVLAGCKRLGVMNVIGSLVDANIGKYEGLNCYGEEKPKRFDLKFGSERRSEIDNFYSDSYSDTPMAMLAKNAYIIKKHKVTDWKK